MTFCPEHSKWDQIYTPKQDNEHPCPFICESLPRCWSWRGDRESSWRVIWKVNALGIIRGWYKDAHRKRTNGRRRRWRRVWAGGSFSEKIKKSQETCLRHVYSWLANISPGQTCTEDNWRRLTWEPHCCCEKTKTYLTLETLSTAEGCYVDFSNV